MAAGKLYPATDPNKGVEYGRVLLYIGCYQALARSRARRRLDRERDQHLPERKPLTGLGQRVPILGTVAVGVGPEPKALAGDFRDLEGAVALSGNAVRDGSGEHTATIRYSRRLPVRGDRTGG